MNALWQTLISNSLQHKLKPKYINMKTLIERYCEAVETTGKEITIQLKDGLTEKLYNKVKAVANRYDIACHAGSYDILLKPASNI